MFRFVMSAYSTRKGEFVTVEKIAEAENITAFGDTFSETELAKIKSLGFVHVTEGYTKKGVKYQRCSKRESIDSRQQLASILG